MSSAAACIYLVTHLNGTDRKARHVSFVAGVSEVTIKHASKFLYEARTHDIPEEIQRARDITKLLKSSESTFIIRKECVARLPAPERPHQNYWIHMTPLYPHKQRALMTRHN